MATRIVYFLADEIPNDIELAELEYLNRKLQVTVMNASENVEFGETDRILPCDYVAGTIPPEYAHIPVYDPESTPGGPIYITDVVGLPAALDAKVDEPVDIADVTGLQAELNTINAELDAAATLPIAIADVTGLQASLDSKQGKPVPISAVTGLQAELDTKAELPIAISDVTGLQAELDAVASLPIAISDVTGLQTSLDSKANLTDLTPIIAELATKADSPIQIQDVEGLETELDSVATLPIDISDVTGLQEALDSAGSLPIEISDVTGLQAELDEPVLISEVTGLQTALDSKADATDLDPIIAELATKQDAPVAISDVTGLQAELDSVATLPIEISDVNGLQAELDSVASLPIAISDVTGLQTALDAPVPIANVTGLQAELDAKADVTDLDPILLELATKADAPVLISDVTGLQTELDGKAELPIAISDVTGLQAELDSSATLPITIADVTGLQTELDGKAELPVTIADVTGLQASLDSKAEVTDLTAIIAELDNKLESPIAISDVTGLQANLDNLQTEIDAAATLPIAISDVTGLQAELDAPIAITDVTGLEAALAEPVGISDVTGLQAELDTKAELTDLDPIITDLNTKAELPIPISGVTNLQTTLDGKAPVSHAHTIANVTGLQAALDSKAATPVPISNVTGLQASLDSKAAVVHGHAIADVSGLQTALDGKSATTHVHPLATTSVDGFFSKTDKDKLDNIASNATNVTFPAANAAGTLASGAPQPANAGAATPAARSDHQHPTASATNDGLMSAANWTKLDGLGGSGGSGVDTTTRTVYVSATGNNANDGLTSGTAKLDFASIWTLLPATLGAPFIVYVTGSVTYIEPPATTKAIGANGYICVIGVGETVVLSGTTTASSTVQTTLLSVGGMTDDAYVGYTLSIKTGTAAGCKRTITYNSTTQIRFSHSLYDSSNSSQVPSATASPTWDIVRPTSLITIPVAGNLINDIPMHFTNIAITSATAGSNNNLRKIPVNTDDVIPSVMVGVEWRCRFSTVRNLNITANGYAFDFTGPIGLILVSMGYGSVFAQQLSYWGVGSNVAGNLDYYSSFYNAKFEGALALRWTFYFYANSWINARGFRACSISVSDNAYVYIFYGYIAVTAGIALAGINCSRVAYVSFNGLVKHLSNSGKQLLSVTDSAIVEISPVLNDSWYTMNGNSLYFAIEVSGNAQLTQVKTGFTWTVDHYPGIGAYGGFKFSENARVNLTYFATTGKIVNYCYMLDNAQVSVNNSLNLSAPASTNNPILYINDNSQLSMASSSDLTCSGVNIGPLIAISGPGARLNHKGATCSIVNGRTASVTAYGIQCIGGGQANFTMNPTITVTGVAGLGYGVNCAGGGKFACAVQPTLVAGGANDFQLTATDFAADTALATSFSHVTFGMSSIQRTT